MTLGFIGLIAAVLVPEAWTCDTGVTVEACAGGVVVSAGSGAQPVAWATMPVEMPSFGPDVIQEIEIENVGALASGGELYIEQLDADGKRLPETLSDLRWTTHIRPVGKRIAYRERGRLHPKAKGLRLKIELRRETGDYDAAGLRITDEAKRFPKFRITKAGLSPAEKEPENPAFFAAGASGATGDRALVLGGENEEALFFQTRSRGSWSGGHQFRNEKEIFYPVGPGTVEASFRPSAVRLPEAMTLFDAYNGYQIGAYHTKKQGRGIGSVMKLVYAPGTRTMSLEMRDYENRRFTANFKDAELPAGEWTHVAVAWTPGEKAEVFVGGKRIGELALPGYKAVELGDMTNRNINDAHAMELYLGAAWSDTRGRKPGKPIVTMFQGAADDFRVSRGVRYAGDFTPLGRFACDDDTAALFTFDDGFDGVSAHGYGYVRACIYANRSRSIVHPPALKDKDDPRKVFNLENYRTMPTDAEFDESRRRVTRSFRLKPGEKAEVSVPERFYMDYVEISNAGGFRPLVFPRLVANGRVDSASFADIRETLGLDGLSDREKADRVFQYVLGASDYFINNQVAFAPGTDKPHTVLFDALAMLNGYCGFECGPLNNMAANLFVTAADCPSSTEFGYGHMFEEVFFDGRNHIYDLSAQKFFPSFDNVTSAGLQEMGDEPGLFVRMDSTSDHFIRKGTRAPYTKDVGYQPKFAFVLNPGERVRWWTSNDGRVNNLQTLARGRTGNRVKNDVTEDERDYAKLVGADDSRWMVFRRDRIFPQYSNALLTFEGRPTADNPAFVDLGADAFAYSVSSPYPIVWGEYEAKLKDGRIAAIELSTDGGRTYRAMPGTTSEYMVKARYAYLVKIKAPRTEVASFRATTEVMFNPRVFPGWLQAGRNELTLKGEGGEADVKVAWREPAKPIRIAPERPRTSSGTVPGFERQLVLVDPGKPLVLSVDGASDKAHVRTFGPLRAKLSGGKLTLAYDGNGGRLFARGADNPEQAAEFPCFAAVDIVDGDAVKSLTAVVSPNARLLTLPRPHMFHKADDFVELPTEGLPRGEYAVFSLSRFPGAEPQYGVNLRLTDPKDGQEVPIAKYHNSAFDYHKAGYARKGERARWKWDTAADPQQLKSGPAGAFSFRFFEAPEKAFRVSIAADHRDGVELAALLVLPKPDIEARLDLKRLLFGINCQPQLIRGGEGK